MELHFEKPLAWRAWLESNHAAVSEVWLVFFKRHTGITTLSYDEAVEEALCFGWIDSLIKRLDEQRYARKFTPRSLKSKWSASNLKRIEKLMAEGRMTPAGLAVIDPSVKPVLPPWKQPFEIPLYFQEALAGNEVARRFYEQLAPSYQRNFVSWVDAAKRPETRQKRLAEALGLLERQQKLGLK